MARYSYSTSSSGRSPGPITGAALKLVRRTSAADVKSIVVGVVAVVLGLCVVLWIMYILRGWWAIRAEALRPRGDAQREPRELEEAWNEEEESDGSTLHEDLR